MALEGNVSEQIKTLQQWLVQSVFPVVQASYEEQQQQTNYFGTIIDYLDGIQRIMMDNQAAPGGGGMTGGTGGRGRGQSMLQRVGQGVNNLVNALGNLTQATKGLAAFQAAPTNKFITFVRHLKNAFGIDNQGGMTGDAAGKVIQAIGYTLGQISHGISRLAKGLIMFAIPAKLNLDNAFIGFVYRLFNPAFLNRVSIRRALQFRGAMRVMSGAMFQFAKMLTTALVPIMGAALFMSSAGISPSMIFSLGAVTGILAWSLTQAAQNAEGITNEDASRVSTVLQYGALGIVAVALAFTLLPSSLPTPPSPAWSLKTGLAILAFSTPFAMIAGSIANQDASLSDLAWTSLAITSLAASLVAAAGILQLLPDTFKAPPLWWSIKSGIGLLAFAGPFAMIAAFTGSLGWQSILIANTAIVTMAASLLGIAYMFQLLPDTFKAPPAWWSLKSGLAILAFSLPLALISAIVGSNIGGIITGSLGAVLAAGAILGVAYIFQALPDEGDLRAPPLDWAWKASAGLLLFGGTVAAIGALATAIGYVGFLAGALGLIVAAGALVGTAWILKLAPAGAFEEGGIFHKAADIMEYFGKKMVNVFTHLVKNLLPYAKEFLTTMAPVAAAFIKQVAEPVGKFAQLIGSAAADIMQVATNTLKVAMNTFVEVLKVGKDLIVGVVGEIGSVISKIGTTFINSIGEMKNFIVDVTGLGSGNIMKTGAALFSMAGGVGALAASFAGSQVAQAGGQLAQGIANVGKAAMDWISGTESTEKPKTVFGMIMSLAKNADAIQTSSNAITGLVNSIKLMNSIRNVNTERISNTLVKLIDHIDSKIGGDKQSTVQNALVTPLGTIVSYEKPIERIAKNMNKISTGLTSTLKQLDKTPDSKLEAFSDMISGAADFSMSSENIGNKLENIKEFIVKLDDTKLDDISDKMGKLTEHIANMVSATGTNETGNLENRVAGVESQQSQIIQSLNQINESLMKINRRLNEPLAVENV